VVNLLISLKKTTRSRSYGHFTTAICTSSYYNGKLFVSLSVSHHFKIMQVKLITKIYCSQGGANFCFFDKYNELLQLIWHNSIPVNCLRSYFISLQVFPVFFQELSPLFAKILMHSLYKYQPHVPKKNCDIWKSIDDLDLLRSSMEFKFFPYVTYCFVRLFEWIVPI
jgi:hypothetical protein